MLFENVKDIQIPEGTVTQIERNGEVIWRKINYLSFRAVNDISTVKAQMYHLDSVEYSMDGETWTDGANITVTLNPGDRVYYRGVAVNSGSEEPTFVMTGKISASGSVMSMLNKDPDEKTINIDNAFAYMFKRCDALIKSPNLPATTLTQGCYSNMFSYCDNLTKAPKLPATALQYRCYYYMFCWCKNLTTAPELPATTLANECYHAMFSGCSALTTAPELPAAELSPYCYAFMFANCSSLNSVKVNTVNWNATYAGDWLDRVAETGNFYNINDISIPVGTSGIPTGWTNIPSIKVNPLTLDFDKAGGDTTVHIIALKNWAITNNSEWITTDIASGNAGEYDVVFHIDPYYIVPDDTRTDTLTIQTNTADEDVTVTQQGGIQPNRELKFTAEQAGSTVKATPRGSLTVEYSLDGTNWINGKDTTVTLANIGDFVFYRGTIDPNASVKQVAKFTLTGKIAASGSVMSMQNNDPDDTEITYSAGTWFNGEMHDMFNGCSALTTAPELPATILKDYCYYGTFVDCTNLVVGPTLPAPRPDQAKECYFAMFRGCLKLNEITVGATTWSTSSADGWLGSVASTGTIHNLGGATIPTNSTSGCPSGWTIVNE